MKSGLILLLLATAAVAAPPITHETVTSGGAQRTYWLLVPPDLKAPAPLLVLLHGSGHDGKILVEHWAKLALQRGIVVAGPDATKREMWSYPADGPLFLRDVVEAVKAKTTIDPSRVYLFGHSAGARFGTGMALMESRYFAAIVANAGALPASNVELTQFAARKVPMMVVIGSRDVANITEARDTRDRLQKEQFPVEYLEIPYGTHDYYRSSRYINEQAWKFLADKKLDGEPKFTEYK